MQLLTSGTSFSLGFAQILGPIQRHSISLLVLRMYAEQSGIGSDWMNAASYVLPELYNDEVAQAVGLESAGDTGTDSASGKMRTMIAYSAIDDGSFIYGNTAIRAFYDDFNELGQILKSNNTTPYLRGKDILKAFADILVEYSGLLASNKDVV